VQIPLLDLKAQYATIKDEIIQAISEVCESQYFALGPAVAQFEENVAAYCGSKFAIGVSSGTDSLLISLMALGVGPGDEVITTPLPSSQRPAVWQGSAQNPCSSMSIPTLSTSIPALSRKR
jgi:dTDP-4-amino-4,6-dideoxygalactose transaminase